MRKLFFGVMVIGLLLVPILTGQKQQSRATSAAMLARGKYLVEDVGLCGDCHTPHNEKGEPVAGQLFKGATLPFKPIVPMPVWADKASNIAGLPGWEKDAAIKFLMTGIAYNGCPDGLRCRSTASISKTLRRLSLTSSHWRRRNRRQCSTPLWQLARP